MVIVPLEFTVQWRAMTLDTATSKKGRHKQRRVQPSAAFVWPAMGSREVNAIQEGLGVVDVAGISARK